MHQRKSSCVLRTAFVSFQNPIVFLDLPNLLSLVLILQIFVMYIQYFVFLEDKNNASIKKITSTWQSKLPSAGATFETDAEAPSGAERGGQTSYWGEKTSTYLPYTCCPALASRSFPHRFQSTNDNT